MFKRKGRNGQDIEMFKKLMVYLKPHRKLFITSLILMTLVVLVDLVPPLFMGLVLDYIGSATEISDLNIVFILLGGFLIVLAIAILLNYIQSMILQVIGQKIIQEIRVETFSHIVNWSPEQLNREPVGKMVTRVMNDSESISQLFTSTVINLIRSFIMMFIIVIVLFVINVKLALITMITIPFIAVVSYFFRKISRRNWRKIRDDISALNSFLSENLSGMKITQVFNQEEKKREEFHQRTKDLERNYQIQIAIFATFRPLIYLITTGGTVLIIYFGGMQVIAMALSFGILYAFQNYASMFFNPIQQIAEEVNNLQDAFSSAEKIFSVLDEPPVIVNDEDAIELEEFKGHIEFKNVWFQYIEDEWVLRDVSFEVKPGQTVALVGATGSGKTTILSLLVRNYEIQKGQILIDGIDIKKIKYQSLRKHIGQMLQDVFLFNATIKENITLFDDSIDIEEVKKAAEYVGANEFIERLSDGYDHVVLERGNNFSAGQRQLISFARAILYNPNLMILDEATANIDSETEVLIQESLVKVMNISTTIVVAHRLSTIQHSDKIMVMSDGEIIERGNHFDLLRQKGHYYQLYELQFEHQEKNL